MAQTATIATAGAAAAATIAGGPLAEVFNEMALMTAIMGMGGGLCLALSTKGMPFIDRGISMALGFLLGGALGIISPWIASKWLGVPINAAEVNPSVLAACSFVVGLAQDFILDRIKKGGK